MALFAAASGLSLNIARGDNIVGVPTRYNKNIENAGHIGIRLLSGIEKTDTLRSSDVIEKAKSADIALASSLYSMHVGVLIDVELFGLFSQAILKIGGRNLLFWSISKNYYLYNDVEGVSEYIPLVSGTEFRWTEAIGKLGYIVPICDLHRTYLVGFVWGGYERYNWKPKDVTFPPEVSIDGTSSDDEVSEAKAAFGIMNTDAPAYLVGVGLRIGASGSKTTMLSGMSLEGYFGGALFYTDYTLKHILLLYNHTDTSNRSNIIFVRTNTPLACGGILSMNGELSKNLYAGWFVAFDVRTHGSVDGENNMSLKMISGDETSSVSDALVDVFDDSAILKQSLGFYKLNVGLTMSILI